MRRTTFLAVAALLAATAAVAQTNTVRCESADGMYVECRTAMLDTVTLSRTLNDSSCVEGKTWGYRNNVIWVDRGCRAEFMITPSTDTITTTRVTTTSSMSTTAAPAPVAGTTNDLLVVCESLNNTRHQCHDKVLGGVTLVRQMSDNPCIKGQSWGINQRGLWVDKGCRAEFSIGGTPTTGTVAPMATHTLVCESGGGKRHCPVDTAFGVRMTRQISSHTCALGRDWGYDENGIWVTNGCRAEFTVNSPATLGMASASSRPVVLCESNRGHRNYCAADTTYGVSLSRQLSDHACVRGSTWGYDATGIWVTGSCRAEFLLDTFR
jgi:Protein of unknown function (DUF3011)